MFAPMPRRNVEGPVSHAKWPTVDAFRSTSASSPWDVDDSTAQTVSRLNCVFGFRPSNAYAKQSLRRSPEEASRYSPDFQHLHLDQIPELRQDTPSEVRTRTSSFGPETPPTKLDSYFTSEPAVQPPTPSRPSHAHIRSHSDSCSITSLWPDSQGPYRFGGEATSNRGVDTKQYGYLDAAASRSGDHSQPQRHSRETSSPHQNYTVTLTRNNRAVTLILQQGPPTKPRQATITCYRQTSLALGGPHAEFFKASEALVLLQHMVNASSMSFVPFSKRERSELMLRMRASPDAMILGEPCSNARAWTSFFSTELGAGRAWEVGTVIFPWKVLERLMGSLNSEVARKRRVQSRAAAAFNRREAEEYAGPRGGHGGAAFQHNYSHSYDSRPVSLHLANTDHGGLEAAAAGDRSSVASGSPPPRTPTEALPPKLQLVSEQHAPQLRQSPPPPPPPVVTTSQIRTRRRQHSEPVVRRLSLTPPRIALLKSNPCRQNLRHLNAASTPTRLEFYDSIRAWPASSHRARVRLPPCSRFLEMVEDQGADSHNPIVV
ncbi:hypothetical protein BDP55DRAFT_695054 [Colletotrichum godetiae]|uniref:Uncharacterized protein n=1 Tax=Colletotrichum godetiae TaxID=1209918 RepID=A0AAJ0AHG1_9PEZI|nr:uncharacterized protein BDP55DRAFT_695054 [Colletotrichum godetiae]KAK1673962.1 hypothetical protein BDP55DRAFT_695054 [Colletotrichum godetiae]